MLLHENITSLPEPLFEMFLVVAVPSNWPVLEGDTPLRYSTQPILDVLRSTEHN